MIRLFILGSDAKRMTVHPDNEVGKCSKHIHLNAF